MLHTFAVSNYRSLRDLKLALAPLTVVTGANGCGKSNLYRALRLLAQAADGRLAEALALEGGIPSVQWAGPPDIRQQAKRGGPVRGTARKAPLRVTFGFAADDVAYEIALGLPTPSLSRFAFDPEIKHEIVWQQPPRRPSNTWLEREGFDVRARAAPTTSGHGSHSHPHATSRCSRNSASPSASRNCSHCASACARGASTTASAPTPRARCASRA
jgi:predicted ATPase